MQFIYATGRPRNMDFAVANTVSALPADATVLATCTPEAEVEHLDDHTFAMMSDAEFYSFRALVSRARKLELQRAHSARRPGFSLRRALGNLLSALLVCCAVCFTASAASAATFTVTNTNNGGAGSLRQVILSANNTAAADTINFNIPGAGVRVIALTAELPEITAPLTIDGYTQPGASPNTLEVGTNAVILIQLDGAAAGFETGLVINASNCTVRGLSITRFGDSGIEISSGNNNIIAGNFIGVDALGRAEDGGVTFGNDTGAHVGGGSGNVVGGFSAAARNLISNNHGAGISIHNPASQTRIEGNLIGVNMTATERLPNEFGVSIAAPNTTLGGSVPGTGNVISSGDGYPCVTTSPNADKLTIIQGNFIGTDPTGARDLGCGEHGVRVGSNPVVIGGNDSAARNHIAFNKAGGILVSPGAQGVGIIGNSIYDNLGLGINLGDDEHTSNDAGDADAGANHLQNYPVITDSTTSGNTVISATLNSEPNSSYRIEFFASPTCHRFSVKKMGRTFLGKTSVSTNSSGNGVVNNFTANAPVAVGSFITATATDNIRGETSEFSGCAQVTGTPFTQTTSIIEDSYVKGSAPTFNFGSAVSLQVKRTLNPGSGKGRQAYLRFDTSSFIGNVGKATLRVYGGLNTLTAENQNIPLAVFPLSDAAWSEYGLQWANKPAPNVPQPLAQVIVTDDTARWYEFDITAFINSERAAERNVTGVILRNMAKSGTGDFFTHFNSSEAPLNTPQLVLAP